MNYRGREALVKDLSIVSRRRCGSLSGYGPPQNVLNGGIVRRRLKFGEAAHQPIQDMGGKFSCSKTRAARYGGGCTNIGMRLSTKPSDSLRTLKNCVRRLRGSDEVLDGKRSDASRDGHQAAPAQAGYFEM